MPAAGEHDQLVEIPRGAEVGALQHPQAGIKIVLARAGSRPVQAKSTRTLEIRKSSSNSIRPSLLTCVSCRRRCWNVRGAWRRSGTGWSARAGGTLGERVLSRREGQVARRTDQPPTGSLRNVREPPKVQLLRGGSKRSVTGVIMVTAVAAGYSWASNHVSPSQLYLAVRLAGATTFRPWRRCPTPLRRSARTTQS